MTNIRRYPSLPAKLISEGLRWCERKRKYNDLRREYVQTKYDSINTPVNVQWIDPDKIHVMQVESDETPTKFRFNYDRVPLHSTDKARFNPHHYAGVVLDGEWDRYVKSYSFDRVFQGIKNHYEKGVPWEETEYIQQYQLRENTYQTDGYTEKELEKTKRLHHSIQENGIQSRYELGQLNECDPPFLQKAQWGITVNVSRNGEYIFNNTAHNRLAFSKILDESKIPVVIVCRHRKWCEKEGIEFS